jgi:CubicO group peptidase (beta-lactamase class C family)
LIITTQRWSDQTTGFVYFHSPSILSQYVTTATDTGIFDTSATIKTLCHPMIYQPGTSWAYSTSIDWAGKLVERASGTRLDKFMQKHIFDPAAATSLTFFPTDDIKAHKMGICYRKPDGDVALIPGGFGMNRPSEVDKVSTELLLGGAGLFGTNKDYLAILRKVLQCDPNAPADVAGAGEKLLSEKAYAELWKGCVSDEGKEQIVQMVSKPAYFDPPASVDNVDHSVGFLINKEDFVGRRKAGSGCWSGAAKTQFWIDPKSGLAVSASYLHRLFRETKGETQHMNSSAGKVRANFSGYLRDPAPQPQSRPVVRLVLRVRAYPVRSPPISQRCILAARCAAYTRFNPFAKQMHFCPLQIQLLFLACSALLDDL